MYQLSDFNFTLPEELIAQYPIAERSASRLLAVDVGRQQLFHQQFTDLQSWLRAGDLLVLNDTKVIPARLHGQKASGGKLECFIERILSPHEALAHLRFSKPPRVGQEIWLAGGACCAIIMGRDDDLFHLKFAGKISLLELLEKYGSIPLPPYIERHAEPADQQRYQTVYATHPGAVAAPTAGLHFDAPMLAALVAKGVQLAYITLHIGAGTFQPVRVAQLEQHKMHGECMRISAETVAAINACRQRGGRVLAVGTTVTRCLETVAQAGQLTAYSGDTHLFIRPGFQFRCVDALLTNFHLPKSTLLMLVAAFGGYDLVMRAYHAAIEHNYRFFSYGDAMLLLNRPAC